MFTLLAETPVMTADAELVRWAIVAIAVVLSIGLIGLFTVSYVSFSRDSKVASEYLTRVFGAGTALYLLTVLAVILSATVLALAGQLQDGAIALLSGIAGYVLGAIRSSSQPRTRPKGAPNAIGGPENKT